MKFRMCDISVIAYANGWTLWHYSGWNTLSTELNPQFFRTDRGIFNVGDKIMMNLKDSYMEAVITKIENRDIYFKTIIKLETQND